MKSVLISTRDNRVYEVRVPDNETNEQIARNLGKGSKVLDVGPVRGHILKAEKME